MRRDFAIPLIFSLSLFTSAFLLFAIQPIAAKIILPIYGGSPAVWTICMLFFQLLLLFSYGYAWFLSCFANKPWLWRLAHLLIILLSLTVFPLRLSPDLSAGVPDLALLKLLLQQLGLPLLVIAASSPLLQFAYSQTAARQSDDPYFLYVASNVGSLLALLSYPCLIEYSIGLNQQFHYWNLGFLVYLLLLFSVFFLIPYRSSFTLKVAASPLNWKVVGRWLGLSFIPCSLMLGVTFYISTDIAATPLFWILPLALYLLSFIITFAKNPIIPHSWIRKNALFFILFPVICFIFGANMLHVLQIIIFHLVGFFILALLCHGELVKIRPSANHLTAFYFCLALGGVLAGLFNGLLAPRLFSSAYEYPLVFVLAMFCLPLPKTKALGFIPPLILVLLLANFFLAERFLGQWLKTNHVIEILALMLLVVWPKNRLSLSSGLAILLFFLFVPWFKPMEVINQQRNFYGIKQVLDTREAHVLLSQSTLHGFQIKKESLKANGSMAYYGSVSSAVQQLQKAKDKLDVTIIGLGTGMMACQFRQDDKLKIIDIDDQVINIASNYFSYLRDCPPSISLITEDGRLALEGSKTGFDDLLLIDAFSSDAIPTHFLTLEAFNLYQRIIKSDGLIMVNISNRHLDLLPVIRSAGRQLDLIVLHKKQAGNYSLGQFPSEWALLTANEQIAMELMGQAGWQFAAAGGSDKLWTDDYSNLLPLIKW